MSNYSDLFELPYLDNELKAKRKIKEPDLTSLNNYEDTKVAKATLFDYLNDKEAQDCVIVGKAGTGKTYFVSNIVEYIISRRHRAKILMCAFTHEAVKVMMNKVEFEHSNLSYSTAHSALAKKAKKVGRDIVYVNDPNKPPPVSEYDYVFVDEISMLPASLQEDFLKYRKDSSKFIWVGDFNQIPPVNALQCDLHKASNYDYYITLYEIKRQTDGNPIIQLANELLATKSFNYDEPINLNEAGDGYVIYDSKDADERDMYIEILEHYFTSDQAKESDYFCRALSYTRKRATGANKYIRGKRMGDDHDLEPLVIGDKLLTHQPIMDDDEKIIATNNSNLTVTKAYAKATEVAGNTLRYFDILCKDSAGVAIKFNALDPASRPELQSALNDIAEAAKNNTRLWGTFHKLKNAFPVYDYAYAMTTHKSQGSTYYATFLDLRDFKYCRDQATTISLMYTAITRASNRLFILL